jgi:hypothetical protein
VHWLLVDPERQVVLQEYLADLRRDPATPPLSVRLRQAIGNDGSVALKTHVETLAARDAS